MVLLAETTFAQSVAGGLSAYGPWITGAAVIVFLLSFVTDAQWKAIMPRWTPPGPTPPGPAPTPQPSPETLTDEAKQFIERKKKLIAENAADTAEKGRLCAEIDARIAARNADIANGEALINGVTA